MTRRTSAVRPTKLVSGAGTRSTTGMPRRTASRAAETAGPGSTPSSSASRSRVRSSTASASTCRPVACRHRASTAAADSRSGSATSSASRASSSASGSPRRSAASADSSTAAARSSSSRAAAGSPNGNRRTSASAGPRHSAVASTSSGRACAGSRRRAAATSDSNRSASTSWRSTVSRYPPGTVATTPRAERPPQPRHERLQRVGDGVGRVGPPQGVDQHVRGHGPAGVEREPGERAAQQHAAGRRHAVRARGHRAEQADPHAAQCDRFAISFRDQLRERVRRAAAPRRARSARTSPGAGSRRCRASGSPGRRRP